jgi:mRNA-degrading endonuclease toxin of MazEF toxin-antitoxin module
MEVKRADLLTIALSGDYGKPRPALVVQADVFDALTSVAVLRLTSEPHDLAVVPNNCRTRPGYRIAKTVAGDD